MKKIKFFVILFFVFVFIFTIYQNNCYADNNLYESDSISVNLNIANSKKFNEFKIRVVSFNSNIDEEITYYPGKSNIIYLPSGSYNLYCYTDNKDIQLNQNKINVSEDKNDFNLKIVNTDSSNPFIKFINDNLLIIILIALSPIIIRIVTNKYQVPTA